VSFRVKCALLGFLLTTACNAGNSSPTPRPALADSLYLRVLEAVRERYDRHPGAFRLSELVLSGWVMPHPRIESEPISLSSVVAEEALSRGLVTRWCAPDTPCEPTGRGLFVSLYPIRRVSPDSVATGFTEMIRYPGQTIDDLSAFFSVVLAREPAGWRVVSVTEIGGT
jgi:hypothetical protein